MKPNDSSETVGNSAQASNQEKEGQKEDPVNSWASNSTEQGSQQQVDSKPGPQSYEPTKTQETFCIATPTITTILPVADCLGSFMNPDRSYRDQEATISSQKLVDSQLDFSESSRPMMEVEVGQKVVLEVQKSTDISSVEGPSCVEEKSPPSGKGKQSKARSAGKKSSKLDAKSKLEKSRQSARECRARKKLRYQYLEDLVCNREKAVVKLRDELAMFCEMSMQIDAGNISTRDRNLLNDQTKENSNRIESSSI